MSKARIQKSSHWTPPATSSSPSPSFEPPDVNIQRSSKSKKKGGGWKQPPLSHGMPNYLLKNALRRKTEASESRNREETPEVQTKLTVGEVGDKYEQEADATAAKVVEQINAPATEPTVQSKVEPVAKPTVMRQGGAAGGGVDPAVEQSIQGSRGSGQGLSESIKEPMEEAFGADFSGVKVHTDGNANQLNRSLHSRAFATGQDIFFQQGEYNPDNKSGQELIAHELTHVVQQGGAAEKQVQAKDEETEQTTVQAKLTVGEVGDKYEQEADTVAEKVVKQINSPASTGVESVAKPTVDVKQSNSSQLHSQLQRQAVALPNGISRSLFTRILGKLSPATLGKLLGGLSNGLIAVQVFWAIFDAGSVANDEEILRKLEQLAKKSSSQEGGNSISLIQRILGLFDGNQSAPALPNTPTGISYPGSGLPRSAQENSNLDRALALSHGSALIKSIQRVVGVKPDGVYGLETLRAVASWQGIYDLGEDGIAGNRTVDKMRDVYSFYFDSPFSHSNEQEETPTGISYPGSSLPLSAQEDSNLKRAEALCYGSVLIKIIQRIVGVEPDGVYGLETLRAVASWQGIYDLGEDGIAGNRTVDKMRDVYSFYFDSPFSHSNEQEETPTGISYPGSSLPLSAQEDSNLKRAEALGYGSVLIKIIQRIVGVEPDGVYGLETLRAVASWQGIYDLGEDGIAGNRTVDKMRDVYSFYFDSPFSHSNEQEETPTGISYPGSSLPLSAQEDSNLKRAEALGYGSVLIKIIQRIVGVEPDGVYGPETLRAVASWQKDNELSPVDGIAGGDTLDEMKKNPSFNWYYPSNSTVPESAPTQTFEPDQQSRVNPTDFDSQALRELKNP